MIITEDIELQEFTRQAIEQIEQGVDIEIRNIDGPINFEVSIGKTIKTSGGLKFYVFNGEQDRGHQQIAKVSFKVNAKESERSKNWTAEVERQNSENAKKWSEWSR